MSTRLIATGLGLAVLVALTGCQAASSASGVEQTHDVTYLGPAMGWPGAELLAGKTSDRTPADLGWLGWNRGWSTPNGTPPRVVWFRNPGEPRPADVAGRRPDRHGQRSDQNADFFGGLF